jgi:hypothetical protein
MAEGRRQRREEFRGLSPRATEFVTVKLVKGPQLISASIHCKYKVEILTQDSPRLGILKEVRDLLVSRIFFAENVSLGKQALLKSFALKILAISLLFRRFCAATLCLTG